MYGGKIRCRERTHADGIKDVVLTDLIKQLDEKYSLYGENVTKYSKVYVNGEKKSSKFLNNTRIELQETELKEGDIITIIQMGSSNTVFRTSAEYIYHDGKIEELTEELKLQLEEEEKKAEKAEDEKTVTEETKNAADNPSETTQK